MKSAPFVIVVGFSLKPIWGKIGPFASDEEADTWGSIFRVKTRSQMLDMTAIASVSLGSFTSISEELAQRPYLPSKDVDEVIRNASVQFLIPT